MVKKEFNQYAVVLFVLIFASLAQANECVKAPKTSRSYDFRACFNSPGLKWAFEAPHELTVQNVLKGPPIKPELSAAEKESGIIFCRFFNHDFSSPGSAKFKCARTTQDGILLDIEGRPVPEARDVSTDDMKLTVTVDGVRRSLGEGYLLDSAGRPLERKTRSGKTELVESDQFKVKYFVDINDSGKMRKREQHEFQFDGQTFQLQNVFVGPTETTTPRWNEVFTEVASTRLFWALGYPADVMIPLRKVVCFGCEAHAKEQKRFSPHQTSVYSFPVIERKMKGSKVADFFNVNSVVADHYPNWSEQNKNDFEGLALLSQLIAYHNFINLQNRLQCEAGKLDKKTGICSSPMPLMQDLGSTWAGRISSSERRELGFGDNPRGALRIYQRGKVFSDPKSCKLFYPITSNSGSEAAAGRGLTHVSREGIEPLKEKLKNLSPQVIRSIFEVARYGDMEPQLRNSAPGASQEEQRAFIINEWAEALEKRIDEIQKANCPSRQNFSQTESLSQAVFRSVASESSASRSLIKKQLKNLSEEKRNRNIENASVTRRNYDPQNVSQFDILEHLKNQCGPNFIYEGRGAGWPELSCRYRPDDGSLGGYSLKFTCEFQDLSKSKGFDKKKVKYARSERAVAKSEVLESIAAPLLSQLIGFYAETYCPVSITCLGCPSTSPWDNARASAAEVAGKVVKIPWAVVEEEIKSITLANRDSRPRSQGLQWNELRKVQTEDAEAHRRMRIEREAWVLWMSFLQATDSHDSNQRVSCLSTGFGADGAIECLESVLYTHDYGHAFLKRFQFQQWKDIPALKDLPAGRGCQGTLAPPHADVAVRGLVIQPVISAEARDLLVDRLRRITDEQLEIIFNLARLRQTVHISSRTWIETFRRKINEMEAAQCQRLDSSGVPRSVLSQVNGSLGHPNL